MACSEAEDAGGLAPAKDDNEAARFFIRRTLPILDCVDYKICPRLGGIREMEHKDISVQARITPEVFREFAVYDTLYRKKRYRRPLAFALILGAFALACFLLRRRADQAVFMGVILLIVGLGLPAVYILSFLYSVRVKAKQLKLKSAPVAYTVTLSPAGVTVTDGKQRAEYPWEAVIYACRLQHSVCLYASESRAYLLPNPERETEDARRWAMITEHIPAERRKDLRK